MPRRNSILTQLSLCGAMAAGLLLNSAPAALAVSDVVSKYDKNSDKSSTSPRPKLPPAFNLTN